MTKGEKQEVLLTIAAKNMNYQIKTFDVRGRDELDFFEVGILGIRDALEEAFQYGMEVANAAKK